jgi:hypothetical protein
MCNLKNKKMEIKTELKFTDNIYKEPYYIFSKKLIDGVFEKIEGSQINLKFVPTKEMGIDLSSFENELKLSEKEIEYLTDGNQLFCIHSIDITSSGLTIWLE